MENKNIEQIQNEVLELTNKIFRIQNSLEELKKQEAQKPKFDFNDFIDCLDTYEIKRHIENNLSAEDYCDVSLSLRYGNEIEIETEWKEVEDIVDCVLKHIKIAFNDWVKEETENQTTEEEEQGA